MDADTALRLNVQRRWFLAGTALLLFTANEARARIISDAMPWAPNAGNPPPAARLGPWQFFTAEEGRTIEALADLIIPPDPQTPGGKDSGSAVFIDRQLAGGYGRRDGQYLRPPFVSGAKSQGPQSEKGPAQQYRDNLAALDRTCKAKFNRAFADLETKDATELLEGLESGSVQLDGADGKAFFTQVITDVQMGFFADPIYGGNRDMVAWKMIGFPGARYNYLDWVNRHNEPFPLPPVGITGRAEWTSKKS